MEDASEDDRAEATAGAPFERSAFPPLAIEITTS